MKVEELRIGNYIFFDGKICTLNSITQHFNNGPYLFCVQCETGMFTYIDSEDIEPIPITEDILLKLGFDKWDNKKLNEFEYYQRFVMYNMIGGTSNYEMHKIHSSYGGEKETEYVTSIDSDERQYNWRMEYLHDLQNACFKETGEELKLKQ